MNYSTCFRSALLPLIFIGLSGAAYSGTPSLAREALAVNFIDKTPPEGRKQGPEGAILASRAFRTAVPDLRCDVEQMIISGNRVVSHLHFHGTFTGTFGELKGKGQKIDFIATDIYEING